MYFKGFRMFVCPCLDPSFLVFYVTFQNCEIPSFLYCFVPIVLECSFGGFVLCKHYEAGSVAVQTMYDEYPAFFIIILKH